VPRYFVTGATGFLGGELVKQLVGRGHQVAALVRSFDRAAILKALGIELYAGDITEPDSLRAPMKGADGVFHVAGWYNIGVHGAGDLAERVNIHGTRHVLEMARDLGIPRVVYTSTVGIFGDTRGRVVDEHYYARGPFLTEYDRTKWIAHYDVAVPMMRAGLPLIIAMPGLVYGPGDRSAIHTSLVQLLRRRLFITPKGVAFSWGYIADIARGLQQAMEAGTTGETYLLTGPIHTFEDALALAARIAGRRPPPVHPPPAVMRMAAGLTAALERWNIRTRYASETLRLMAGTTWIGSSAKAQQALGFTARPLDEGLRHTIEYELRQLGLA